MRCVNQGGWISPAGARVEGPPCGALYTVGRTANRPHAVSGEPTGFVAFDEFGLHRLFLAEGFRPVEDGELGRLANLAAAPRPTSAELEGCAP